MSLIKYALIRAAFYVATRDMNGINEIERVLVAALDIIKPLYPKVIRL